MTKTSAWSLRSASASPRVSTCSAGQPAGEGLSLTAIHSCRAVTGAGHFERREAGQVELARGMRLQAGLGANPTISFERRQEPGGTDQATDRYGDRVATLTFFDARRASPLQTQR